MNGDLENVLVANVDYDFSGRDPDVGKDYYWSGMPVHKQEYSESVWYDCDDISGPVVGYLRKVNGRWSVVSVEYEIEFLSGKILEEMEAHGIEVMFAKQYAREELVAFASGVYLTHRSLKDGFHLEGLRNYTEMLRCVLRRAS